MLVGLVRTVEIKFVKDDNAIFSETKLCRNTSAYYLDATDLSFLN